MTDKHDAETKKLILANEYHEKIQRQEENLKRSLSADQYEFFGNNWYIGGKKIQTEILKAINSQGIRLSEYISQNFERLFGNVVSAQAKDIVLYFSEHLGEYQYSNSYRRRSFRSKNDKSYISVFAEILHSCTSVSNNLPGAPLDKILNRELPEDAQAFLDSTPWGGCGYSCWQVAYALDHNDSRIEEAVYRIITEENSSSMLTSSLIRGILVSHREDFHELVCKLLLAAKLQEGLRQVICENADFGTREAFLKILKTIDDNRLIRFSSVKRAVGTWLGILADEARDLDRISEKSVRLIIDCLESTNVREEYLYFQGSR